MIADTRAAGPSIHSASAPTDYSHYYYYCRAKKSTIIIIRIDVKTPHHRQCQTIAQTINWFFRLTFIPCTAHSANDIVRHTASTRGGSAIFFLVLLVLFLVSDSLRCVSARHLTDCVNILISCPIVHRCRALSFAVHSDSDDTQRCWPFVLPVDFYGKIEHNALLWLLLLGLVLEAAAAAAAAVAPCFMVNRIVFLRSRSATAALLLRNLNFSIEKIAQYNFFRDSHSHCLRACLCGCNGFIVCRATIAATFGFHSLLKMLKWPRIRWNRHRVGIVRSMMTLIAAWCHTCIDNVMIQLKSHWIFCFPLAIDLHRPSVDIDETKWKM